jgi:TPR repeat protein
MAAPALRRSFGAIALGGILVAGVASCRSSERAARAYLEAEGLEQIRIAAVAGDEGGFTYTARRQQEDCVGHVAVRDEPGMPRISDRMSCRPRLELCSTDDPTTCFRLGLMHQKGDDSPIDPTGIDHETAAGFFDIACQGGHGRACNALGLAYVEGRGLAVDLGRAHQSFERACRFGSPKGCFNQGLGHHHGRGVERDPSVAVGLYERACGEGLASACYNLGVCRRDGTGMPRNPQGATSSFAAACASGHLLGCVNLGVMYATGDGIPVDEAAARSLFQKACSAGAPEGCRGLEELDRAG